MPGASNFQRKVWGTGQSRISARLHARFLDSGIVLMIPQAARAVPGQVSFVNTMGILEAGLDHGGLVKEFLEEVRSARSLLQPIL